jgi:hypothetical protein
MAITRGQMQRQLRRGGGIMDVASGTIGGGNYAGIPMGSRTGFGVLKKLKKGIRKIIPNEIADIAVKAAPFVAPFNPALAGAMAGIGSFDQTGSLSGALKRGALTYGGGQAARFIGGAGFQGNPFTSGGAFTPSGFTGGFSSPLGTETGIGKLFRKSPEIEAISGTDFQQFKETPFGAKDTLGGEMLTTETIVDPSSVSKAVATTTKQTTPSITKLIKEGNYTEAAVEAGKKGLKSIFTTPITDADGNVTGSKLDKTALLAAGSFGLTYLDAKKIADDAGVDIGTESEYDEATKEEKKKEYAGYLQNFFGGKKDGGRIGYMFGDRVEDKEGIMSMSEDEEDENTKMAYFPGDVFSKAEISRLFRDKSLTTNQDRKQLFRILMNPGMFPEAEEMLKKLLRGKQDGGRIGAKDGFSFMELIDDKAYNKRLQEKEDLINELIDKGYRFEDIMQLVSPRTKRLMDDGTYKEYGDAPSISLGKIGLAMGGEVPVRKNKAGIEELDYRQTGGFVPVGVKEKADDVPAMLSKNEFVLTADAVRGIGGGDVEKGAEKLYGVMKQAEKVGRA